MWELFSARKCKGRFLLSDDPVVLYNCDCYPTSEICHFPNDPDPFWRGTRVVYALSRDSILVISHIEHIDAPSRTKARRPRRNARSHDEAMISYLNIVNERELSEEQVATINYAIKRRASKYIASVCKDDLFPEKIVGEPRWVDIDKLFQTEDRSFLGKTEMIARYKDGTTVFTNAYGERDVVPGWFVREQERKKSQASS
ncbi:MAG: hypothetical protein QOG66_1517 [Methylobacteriaceae bacterium]|jgi:hypothetical protein|nr:hypothetical protein [Methylobacteriaceae bacterium]